MGSTWFLHAPQPHHGKDGGHLSRCFALFTSCHEVQYQYNSFLKLYKRSFHLKFPEAASDSQCSLWQTYFVGTRWVSSLRWVSSWRQYLTWLAWEGPATLKPSTTCTTFGTFLLLLWWSWWMLQQDGWGSWHPGKLLCGRKLTFLPERGDEGNLWNLWKN